MTDMPCIRGCILRGSENNDEPTLMVARHGSLCDSCYYRLKHALEMVPSLVANIRAQVIPGGGASDGLPRGSRTPPAPLSVTAVDDADTMYAKLVLWTEAIGGEMRVRQPKPVVWSNFQEVQGFKPVTVEVAYELISELAGWFLTHLESICYLPVVKEFHDDLCWGWEDSLGVFSLMGRYPIEPRNPTPAEKRECQVCGRNEVFVEKPTAENPDIQVICGHCQQVIDPKAYAKYRDILDDLATA